MARSSSSFHNAPYHDEPCPVCGPHCSTPTKRNAKKRRVWGDIGFQSWYCARCGDSGFERDPNAPPPDPEKIKAAQREAAERKRINDAERERKAQWLWAQRRPIKGSPAEVYLRARGITCALPATLGYLPARGEHCHAMIAAFGIPDEPEPGVLSIAKDAVRAVHLTKLAPDGCGKADVEKPKIVIAPPRGSPIVLAPANDLLGLVITEGIEEALSGHQVTGRGACAAGSAPFMPALAATVPDYIECITIVEDDNDAGRKGTNGLAEGLRKRGFEVFVEGLS